MYIKKAAPREYDNEAQYKRENRRCMIIAILVFMGLGVQAGLVLTGGGQ